MNKNAVITRYRPKVLAEVVGQGKVVSTLIKLVESGNIYHNHYLISGKYGTGKTTLAKIMAKTLLCEDREETLLNPCDKCPACVEVLAGGIMRGFQEIDAGSQGGVDEIRNIVELAKLHPGNNSGWKVYMIDECHLLTKPAGSAMLKALEANYRVVFILVTTDPQKLLETVKSRLKHIVLDDPPADAITGLLNSICIDGFIDVPDASKDAFSGYMRSIAEKTEPHIRDSLNMLDEFKLKFCNKLGVFEGKDTHIKEFMTGDSTTWYELLKMINKEIVDPAQYNTIVEALIKGNDRPLIQQFTGLLALVSKKAIGETAAVEGMTLGEYRGTFYILYEAWKENQGNRAFFKQIMVFALSECAQAKRDGVLGGLQRFAGDMIENQKRSEALLDTLSVIAGKEREVRTSIEKDKAKESQKTTALGDVDYED